MIDIIVCDDHSYRGPKPCPDCVEAEHPACVRDDKKDDGGPAFPVQLRDDEEWAGPSDGCGMSLRDWFAGMALSSCAYGNTLDPTAIAEIAYARADAMIEARNR